MSLAYNIMIIQERIEKRLVIDTSGCWIWMGGTSHGYGHIKINGKTKKVHRVMWELTNGPIPEGIFVLHTCDIPECANPDHLFLGTHTDNMRDMIKKGRKSPIVRNTGITHCKHGHSFDEKNTRYYMWKGKEHRSCRTCNTLRLRLRAKRKANG